MDDIVNLLKKLTTHVSNGIRVCMPATIEDYDFLTQQASVKIDMQELYEDGTTLDYPVISGVPVVFMASGGASITMPVNRGDSCLLIYADRDMSNWLLGGTGQKPDSTRMHNLSDAIAITGLFPFTSEARAENNTDVLIKYAGSKIMLKPDGVINIETTKDINVKSVDNINIDSKNVNINSIENVAINCKNATIVASENVNIECVDANITATNEINSKSITFIQTGDMKISGNLELSGEASGNGGGAVVFSNGITNTGDIKNTGNIENTGGTIKSGAITLETHTHSYNAPVVGSSPTTATPSITGTPT